MMQYVYGGRERERERATNLCIIYIIMSLKFEFLGGHNNVFPTKKCGFMLILVWLKLTKMMYNNSTLYAVFLHVCVNVRVPT